MKKRDIFIIVILLLVVLLFSLFAINLSKETFEIRSTTLRVDILKTSNVQKEVNLQLSDLKKSHLFSA